MVAPSTERIIQQLRAAAPCLDPPWMSRAVATAADCLEKLGRLERLAETGTAKNFLDCDDETKRAIFALAAEESARRKALETEHDYYPSHEALHDLVSLISEHDALTGGGPGWKERWRKAVLHAEELVRVED